MRFGFLPLGISDIVATGHACSAPHHQIQPSGKEVHFPPECDLIYLTVDPHFP